MLTVVVPVGNGCASVNKWMGHHGPEAEYLAANRGHSGLQTSSSDYFHGLTFVLTLLLAVYCCPALRIHAKCKKVICSYDYLLLSQRSFFFSFFFYFFFL